jgi:hypothetical protein
MVVFFPYGNANIAASGNGQSWAAYDTGQTRYLSAGAYGNGRFIAVSNATTSGLITTTGTGNWAETTTPFSLSSLAFGAGVFAGVRGYGSAADTGAYCTDGTDWATMTMPSSQRWHAITYGGGKFVAIAYGSDAGAYSEDGINWTPMTMPLSAYWQAVSYAAGRFFAVIEGSSTAAVSLDGITWETTTLPAAGAWAACAGRPSDGLFAAVKQGSSDMVSGIAEIVIYQEPGGLKNPKQLSEANYTTIEKTKLAGIEAEAQKNTVSSVADKTGAVTLTASDVGLGNVDNTSDADKPLSTAQQAALDDKLDRSAD